MKYVCSVCGYKDPARATDTASTSTTLEETEKASDGISDQTVVIVWVVVAVIMVIAAVVFIAVAVKNKKK